MQANAGTFLIDNKSTDLPVKSGTIGPDVVDIGKLYAQTGMFTYDPGFTSTASCESKITYIDGDEGILLYRGFPIEQLAEHGDFLETCYLLLYGELPTKAQKADFDYTVTRHTMVHEQMARFFQGFRRDAHPMAVMVGCVGALSAFYHDSTDISDPKQRMIASMRMIAKMPTLAAMAYKYVVGQPFIYPKNDLDYTSNFLRMCFAVPCEDYKVNPIMSRALDRIFILHADHEQNASTSTVRLAGSSGANPFACIAAGIACLWGPAHGGANEAALKMLAEIGSVDRIPQYVARAKDKNDSFRLMGFGHRVYKNYDPRAKIMQKTCHEVLSELGIKDDPLLDVAIELERIALSDDYFISKKLYPNVDFYSGITLKALGFPVAMFTVLFALARTVGWIAQWKEMIEDPGQKIGRPRQLYTGRRPATIRPSASAESAMAAYDQSNVFAKILRGEMGCHKVFEDDVALAFMDIMPRVEGHVLVIPKHPARGLLDMPSEALSALMPRVRSVGAAVVRAMEADGLTLQQFNEAAGGQVVFHLHFHLLPRHEGVGLRPPGGPMEKPEVLEALAERIKAAL